MLRKEAGDEIAKIFKDLMRKNAAGCGSYDAVDVEVSEAKDHHMKDHHAYDADDDEAINMMLDNMMDDEEVSAAEDLIGNVKDKMGENFMHDHGHDHDHKKMASLMSGLGKIAGSLRRKGEDFAADVVEATAISIDNDFRKTASRSRGDSKTISELQKISRELRQSKNSFAADLVDSTIKKIR